MDDKTATPFARSTSIFQPRTLLSAALAAALSVLMLAVVLVAGRPPGPAGAAPADLGTWTAATALPEPLWAFAGLGGSSDILVFGGENATFTNTATPRRAAVQPDGTLGPWQEMPSFALSAPRIDFGIATATRSGYACVYVAGGYGPDPGETVTNTVEYYKVGADLSVLARGFTAPLNASRAHFGLVPYSTSSGSSIYAVGGATNTVEFAPVNSDCTLGTWQVLTSTLTASRTGLRSFTARGYLYAVGGMGAVSRTVEYAPIRPNGTLGTFTTTSSLNTGRADMAVVFVGGPNYAYVLGGLGSGFAPLPSVERAAVNSNGTLGPWTAQPGLATARENMAFATANGRFYLLGGRAAGGVTNTVEYAAFEGAVPSISGGVLAPDGIRAVTNTSVLLWSGDRTSGPSGPPVTSTQTSLAGAYQFYDLSPGVYTLQAWVSDNPLDYASSNRVTVTAQAGQAAARNLSLLDVDILGLARTVTGTAITRPSDDSNQGARVNLQNSDRTVNLWYTTNLNGFYKFGGLVTDSYTLQAYPPYTGSFSLLAPSQRAISFTAGLSQTVNVTLGPPIITGTVIAPNSQAVTRTNVSLWDDQRIIQRSVSGNDLGQFAFPTVPQGAYWVQASPPSDARSTDYAQSAPRLVQVVSGTTTYAGVLALTIPSITGTVAVPGGTPASGAGISVYNADHSVNFGLGTDTGGRFRIRELPSGDYFVRANPPSGSLYAGSLPKRVTVTLGLTANAGTLTLTTPCISGRGLYPNGNPVTQTGVSYYSADATNPVREGTGVDQQGRFNIGGLSSGDYYVQINAPSGSPYVSSSPVRVTVVATDTTCVPVNVGDLRLGVPPLRGRVVDPAGDPVARAGLSIRKADRSLSFGTGTDENGRFISPLLSDGDWVVTANPPQGSDLGNSLPVTVTNVVSGTTRNIGDVSLTRLSLTGRLLLPNGTPAQRGGPHVYNDSRTIDMHTGVDSRGIYRFSGLDAGTYRLELDVPWESTGLIAPTSQQVTVVAGQTTHVADISYLTATKHIAGQVLKRNDDGTTAPVAGAIVWANKDDGTARASERTGADGRFALDLGGGTWLTGVGPDRSPGAPVPDWTYGQPSTAVSFARDNTEETRTLDFTVLAAGATVRGLIRLPDGAVPAPDSVSVGVHNDSGFSTGTRPTADGSFSLRVPGGVYRFGGRPNDPTLAMPVLPPFSVGSTEDKDLGTITLLSRNSRISGRVLDSSGQGISDIEVQAWPVGGGALISTRTITEGVYSLMVMSGTWETQARPGPDSDYTIITPPTRVTLASNETQEVDFSLLATDATILGKIVDSGLNVISDFEGRVSVVREIPGLPSVPMGGAQIRGGIFTLNLPAGRNYRVFATCPSGCRYSVQEEVGLDIGANETRRLNLTARGADATMAGLVMDTSGSPVQNLRGTVRAVGALGMQRTDLAPSGAYTMAVTSGTTHLGLWVDPNSGYVWEQVPVSATASSGVTSTVNFTVTLADSAVSGTVRDPGGTPLDGAWVWAELPRSSTSPVRFVKGQVSKDGGRFRLPLTSGKTYNIRAAVAEERGYISPEAVAITITLPATITQDLQFRQSNAQVRGVVTLAGSAHSAFVRAWGERGGHTTATAGADGSYVLNVTRNDRWRIVAVSEVGGTLYRSNPVVIGVGETSPVTQDLVLTLVGTVPNSVSLTFDSSQMQVISLSDGTQVTIPGGSLAVSGTVTVLAVPKSSVPAQRGAEPVSLGYDLAATDADGNAITSFLRNVTVVIRYTEEQLAALGITEDQVIAKYWDTTTSTWQTPENVIQDRENNTLTISTNHFTVFAGILGSGDITAGTQTRIYIPFAAKNRSGGW